VHVERGVASLPAAGASAAAAEGEVAERVAALLEAAGLTPPSLGELAASAGADAGVTRRALGRLQDEGRAVQVSRDLFFAAAAVQDARERLRVYLVERGSMRASDARDVLGLSRKFVVPLLEYFDAQGFTRRAGDERTLRESV
jgi:selenocysteine-specific elongation factor